MKKLSKIIASVFMLAVVVISGAMLVGCGEKDFDKDKIKIGQTSFTYDGSSHVFEVTYEDDKTVEFTVIGELEYKLPKCDVVLLPIDATTAESLSVYITDEIVKKLENTDTLEYIEVQVNEGIGQGASYHKEF